MKDKLLLTPEERDKAWEDAFEKPIYLDHEPTADELFNLRLDCVAQAQLTKAEPIIRKDERERILNILRHKKLPDGNYHISERTEQALKREL